MDRRVRADQRTDPLGDPAEALCFDGDDHVILGAEADRVALGGRPPM